jgi:hypothetical protein
VNGVIMSRADEFINISKENAGKKIKLEIKREKDNPCKEFMEYKKIGKDGWDVESRYTQIHTNNRYINYILRKFINKRKFIEGFVPYGGSCWWILTDKAVRYIIETYEKYYI